MKQKIIEILKEESRLFIFTDNEGVDHPFMGIHQMMFEKIASRIEELINNRQCMYCEKELKPNEAIILCKECTE